MSLFSRRKGRTPDPAEPTADAEERDLEVAADDAEDAPPEPERAPGGPYDVDEVDGLDGRIDLGALWVRGVQGLELRLEMDQSTSTVIAATFVLGESAAQVQAFAAPKSSGVWREIRSEIAASISEQGGTAEQVDGPLGTELRTRMPSAGPDGRTVFAPARFLGVDGPRWFLRAVLSGRAAIDDDAAAPLIDVVREIVVVRGQDPMAPREMLPLSLPNEASAEVPTEAAEPASTELNPFERGPEITEVR